jgi:hypothetical protein
MKRIDFGIITNGKRPAKLRATLDSIWAQNIEVENLNVFVCGDILRARCSTHMDYAFGICAKDEADKGLLGAMRNKIVDFILSNKSQGPSEAEHIVVIADDDMLFDAEFCESIIERENDWDIICPRIENPDGTRYWDWAACGDNGHKLLPYTQEAGSDWYNTGGLCIAKLDIFGRVGWPDEIPINNAAKGGKNEDVIFSDAVKKANLRIKCEPKAIVVHDDTRITSKNKNHLVAK